MFAGRKLRAASPVTGLLAALLMLAGCAGAPVQTMSDTRQTIRAAEAAGAERVAPESLAAAREGLLKAKQYLDRHDYRAARREAEAAHSRATEALQAAQSASRSQEPR
ncbi:MAG: DUF4398 domain-containing protein [Steroidobacteraceae bacterium]|nr:DUF4398 domain-containing protein [Steroidobacteraceae bacterium]